MPMRIINHIVLLIFIIFYLGCHAALFQRPSKETILQLKQKYGVKLASTWTAEQADKLLYTFGSIYRNAEDTNYNLKPSLWKISKKDLDDDVHIETVKNTRHVTLRHDVFPSEGSHPETPQEESQSIERPYSVIARFITDEWKDLTAVKLLLKDTTNRYAIELVLKEMYGLNLVVKDTPEATKISQKLHKYVGEVKVSKFTNKELLMIMSVYEKFPLGLHKIPKLKYLLRSQKAPYAGSAWIIADCVEYAAVTFRLKNQNEFKRIIIHEKAHFLWEYALNGKLRQEWSKLGGWYKDKNKRHGWSNNKSKNEFVTSYASSKNPNEDWAESVAYFLIHPKKLRACSPSKYNFIERVIHLYSESVVPFARLKDLED